MTAMMATAAALVAAAGAVASSASAVVTRQVVGGFDGSNGTGQPVVAAAVDSSGGPGGGSVYVGLASGVVLGFERVGTGTPVSMRFSGVEIKGKKTPQGSFSLPFSSGVAVDSSGGENGGDVYVADDIEDGVVDRFNAKGRYLCQITGAATPSESECGQTPASERPESSIEPRGVAVDSKGDVYVADAAHGVIDEFGPSGKYLGQLVDPKPDPGALAVDSSGDVFVANGEEGIPLGVAEFAPDGSVVPRPELEAVRAVSVALDPTSGDLLVSEPPFGVSELASGGGRLASFAAGGGGAALAVAEASDFVFANASSESIVEIYGSLEHIPEVSTLTATGVAAESATLGGQVTPDAEVPTSECIVEYETAAEYAEHPISSYGGRTQCEPDTPPAYIEATAVRATVKLAPSTTYHFRLTAKGEGVTSGGSRELTTPAVGPAAPAVSAQGANPSLATATVRAEVAPGGSAVRCEVQFVEEAQFEVSGYAGAASAPCSGLELGEGYSAQRALAQLSGLRGSTVYHYRFVATNATGTGMGEDATFATFGIRAFSVQALGREGHPYTQAGGHPYNLVTSFEFNIGTNLAGERATDANPKDIIVALPPGYIGDPNATQRCTLAELYTLSCSPAAQVGTIHLALDETEPGEESEEPLFNLVPPAGYPAAFGFRVSTFVSAESLFKVRTGGDYGVDAESLDITTDAGLEGATVDVWGALPDGKPFLTDPTSCTGSQTATMRADSWQDPGDFVTATTTLPGITGCSSVPFTPEASVQPTTRSADSPTGLVTNIGVPVEEAPEGVVQSEVRQTVVRLPAGVTVSPSGANGLEACSPEQIAMGDASEPACPGGSRLGSVQIETPVLPDVVKGSVFLAQQNQNPFGSTLAIYLYAQADGAVIKLAGHVSSNPMTGQLTTTFAETPQLPFKSLRLTLDEGPRAALATPVGCGSFASELVLDPWSGLAPVSFASPFEVTAECGGGFAPGFTAGSGSAQAGAYAPLVFSFSREDGEQELSGLTATLPTGVAAKLAGVPLCSDAAAAAGACPEESRVGAVTAYAGPGPDPLVLHGGAYLTGTYKGAPYGMAVEVPAIAGPFDLGTVTVREALFVDPHDAHVTAVSDPFPTIIDVTGANGETDGLPVRLRRVDVSIDRPQFTFNPTSCEAKSASAVFTSIGGASVSRTVPFQVANCQSLAFDPMLSASAAAQGSKADGTTFSVKVVSGGLGAGGVGQAGIAKVDLQLPKQLSSRLSTLQKACLAATFEANPSACDGASAIGTATVHTPILASPLTGPGYLVSHGGAAFPDVEFVLQGDGITLILDGKTDIKNGITYSRFESNPDAPFTSFEAELPAGPHSALTADVPEPENYSLCKQTLSMPSTIMGQNGIVIEHDTPITLTGCAGVLPAKAHEPSRAQQLAKALAKCRGAYKHNYSKRATCEASARKRYVVNTNAKGKKKHG